MALPELSRRGLEVTGFVLQVVSSGGVPGRGLRRAGARPPERIDCPTLPALHSGVVFDVREPLAHVCVVLEDDGC